MKIVLRLLFWVAFCAFVYWAWDVTFSEHARRGAIERLQKEGMLMQK